MSVRPPSVKQTSRIGLRDSVASGIKCGSHGGKNGRTKLWPVPWLSLKAKIKPRRRGGQVISGDWREATPSPHGFQWFTIKPLGSLVDPQIQDRSAAALGWSDRWVTGLTSLRWRLLETSKRRTHVGIAMLASRLRKLRSSGIRSMALWRRFPKCASGVCILVLCIRSSFVFQMPPYNPSGERMTAISWNPSSFPFVIFPSYFP
jgi:hypothetical protein